MQKDLFFIKILIDYYFTMANRKFLKDKIYKYKF